MIILYINCKKYPFIQWILSGKKTMETRNKNTLKSLVNKTVYLAETGKGKKTVIYGKCIITGYIIVNDKRTYNKYRKQTCIEKGSYYDFTTETRQKVLYIIDNVERCKPFAIPENIAKHGRIYAETL